VTTTESVEPVAVNEWARTAVAVSPAVIEEAYVVVVAELSAPILNDSPKIAACDGTIESIERPIAAIADRATRLKNVVLDITFLSLVVVETFPSTAGKE